MTDLEVLKAARQVISEQSDIAKGSFCNEAKCFCTMGAIGFIYNNKASYYMFDDDGRKFANLLGFDCEDDVFDFNDNSNKKDVLKRFDEAIARLEEAKS